MKRFLMTKYFYSIAKRDMCQALAWESPLKDLDMLYLLFDNKGVSTIIELALDTRDTSLKEIMESADEAYNIVCSECFAPFLSKEVSA